jgi:hypothetical protein
VDEGSHDAHVGPHFLPTLQPFFPHTFSPPRDPREIMRTVHPHSLDTIHPSQMSTSPNTELQGQHHSQQQLLDLSRESSPDSNIAQLVVKVISAPKTASSSPHNASQALNPPLSAPGTPQPPANASISPINATLPPALPPVDPNISFQSILTASKEGPSANGQHAPWNVPGTMPPSQQLASPSAPRPVSHNDLSGRDLRPIIT